MLPKRSLLLSASALVLPLALAGVAVGQMEADPMAPDPMETDAMGVDPMAGDAMAVDPMATDAGMMDEMTDVRIIRITIENLTAGQTFSPAFIVSQTPDATPLFALGEAASEPLWNVAEGGNIGPFSAEAAGLIGAEYGNAEIAVHTPPGGVRTLYVVVDEAHPRLSGVWMLGMTNDGFSGFADVHAYHLTEPMTLILEAYDAGTEINNERAGFLGALGEGNMRDPENGVVTIHTGIRGDADAPIAWNFDPHMVARVTFTPIDTADMADDMMGDGMH